MKPDGYLDEIRSYIARTFGAETPELSDEQPLLGDVVDSIGVLKLAGHLEETYGITIGAHEMDPQNFGNLKALAEFVARKTAAR